MVELALGNLVVSIAVLWIPWLVKRQIIVQLISDLFVKWNGKDIGPFIEKNMNPAWIAGRSLLLTCILPGPRLNTQRDLVVLMFSQVFWSFLPFLGEHAEFLFLELSWRNRHCSCLFHCNQPHFSVLSKLGSTRYSTETDCSVKKNKFIQLLAQHHLNNSKWLGINSLCQVALKKRSSYILFWLYFVWNVWGYWNQIYWLCTRLVYTSYKRVPWHMESKPRVFSDTDAIQLPWFLVSCSLVHYHV